MGSRKPKPTQLKEHTKPKSKMGLSRLFATANELVPVNVDVRTKSQSPYVVAPPLDDKTMKLDDPRLNEPLAPQSREDSTGVSLALTRVSAIKPLSSAKTKANEPVGSNTSVRNFKSQVNHQAQSKKKSSSGHLLPWLCIIPAIALFSYVAFAPSAAPVVPQQSQLSTTQIQERLDFHRSTTGSRLNRERIDVQIQNHMQSPDIGFDAHKVKPYDMMKGVPLTGEVPNYSRNEKKQWPVNPSHPDAKIMYGLQEEQERMEFERRAQTAWVREFKENALKEGYVVEVDKFGNVKAKRLPAEQIGPLPDDN